MCCMICIDLAKGKLTTTEASRNLAETLEPTDEHYWEVSLEIANKKEEEELDREK